MSGIRKAVSTQDLLESGENLEDLTDKEVHPHHRHIVIPLPENIARESKEATQILRGFENMPKDERISPYLFKTCKGVVITSVFEFGLIGSLGFGSGLLLKHHGTGMGWSAPVPVTCAGGGFGVQVGATVGHAVIFIMTESAMEHFQKKNEFLVGSDFEVCIGTFSSHDTSVTQADCIVYCRNKGLYGGWFVKGSMIHVRKRHIKKLYGKETTLEDLWAGNIAPPEECQELIDYIKEQIRQAV